MTLFHINLYADCKGQQLLWDFILLPPVGAIGKCVEKQMKMCV